MVLIVQPHLLRLFTAFLGRACATARRRAWARGARVIALHVRVFVSSTEPRGGCVSGTYWENNLRIDVGLPQNGLEAIIRCLGAGSSGSPVNVSHVVM